MPVAACRRACDSRPPPRAHAGNAHGARAVERRSWRLAGRRTTRPGSARSARVQFAPRGRRPSRRPSRCWARRAAEIPATSAAFGVLRARGAVLCRRGRTRGSRSVRALDTNSVGRGCPGRAVDRAEAAGRLPKRFAPPSPDRGPSWERARFSSASARACSIRAARIPRRPLQRAFRLELSPTSRRTSARSRSQLARVHPPPSAPSRGELPTSTRSPRPGFLRAGRHSPRCGRPWRRSTSSSGCRIIRRSPLQVGAGGVRGCPLACVRRFGRSAWACDARRSSPMWRDAAIEPARSRRFDVAAFQREQTELTVQHRRRSAVSVPRRPQRLAAQLLRRRRVALSPSRPPRANPQFRARRSGSSVRSAA